MEWINPTRNPDFVNKDFFSDCPICGYTVGYGKEPDICPNCHIRIKDIQPSCNKCVYGRKLLKEFKVGEGHKESYCCIMLLIQDKLEKELDPDYKSNVEPWVQEVDPETDYCEMFRERKEE